MSNNDAGASRSYLLRKRKVGDLPLSSCADDDSPCAWVAFAGRSGRSQDVQSAYPIDAVSAEQYFIGFAHCCASLDPDPQIQRGRSSWSSRSLWTWRSRSARIASRPSAILQNLRHATAPPPVVLEAQTVQARLAPPWVPEAPLDLCLRHRLWGPAGRPTQQVGNRNCAGSGRRTIYFAKVRRKIRQTMH
jgi:hypothetical protein